MIDLSVSRQQIDEIDSQIVDLFEKRMAVSNEVAKYKLKTGKPVLLFWRSGNPYPAGYGGCFRRRGAGDQLSELPGDNGGGREGKG